MAKDFTGCRYGKLVAVRREIYVEHRQSWRWTFRCDCGASRVMDPSSARVTQHCGCESSGRLHRRHLKHGRSHTAAYKAWAAMKDRCYNPNCKFFQYYGGRGITVCERWRRSYENFLADMGERPPGMTIERVDVNGPYELRNCRWATRREQARNTRVSIRITVDGVTRHLYDWAERIGVRPTTILARIGKGMSPKEAVSTPSRSKRIANITKGA